MRATSKPNYLKQGEERVGGGLEVTAPEKVALHMLFGSAAMLLTWPEGVHDVHLVLVFVFWFHRRRRRSASCKT